MYIESIMFIFQISLSVRLCNVVRKIGLLKNFSTSLNNKQFAQNSGNTYENENSDDTSN